MSLSLLDAQRALEARGLTALSLHFTGGRWTAFSGHAQAHGCTVDIAVRRLIGELDAVILPRFDGEDMHPTEDAQ